MFTKNITKFSDSPNLVTNFSLFTLVVLYDPTQVSEVAEIGGEECPERAGIHNGSSELSRTT